MLTGRSITGLRKREGALEDQYAAKKLRFHESTYHYSSEERERAFTEAQFPTPELMRRYRDYRQEWHRRSAEMDAGASPLAVIIELVSSCNLRCEMCYTRTPGFQASVIGAQRMLPWDTVVRLVDECAEMGVCSILFSWRGASSLYTSRGRDGVLRDFADALHYARDRGILEVTSLTNGRALNDKLIEKIVQAQPNWISFSIDGLHETYDKIRAPVPGDRGRRPFEVVLGHLKKMVEVRDRLGQKLPQIRTNTIYPAIADDPERYRRVMEEAGVGLVTINELLDFRGAELPDDAIADDWFCQYPFQRLVVSANGVILPCPGSHTEEQDMILGRYPGTSRKRVIRDGREQSINPREITLQAAWNCHKIQAIRAAHRENHRKEIVTCRHCRHGVRKHGAEWIPEDWDMEAMKWRGREWRT
jgi:hypothetical protein